MFLLALFFWGGRDEFVFLQCVFESWPLRRDAALYSKSYAPADPDPDRGRSAAGGGGRAARRPHFFKRTFCNFFKSLQFFGGLVLGCIETNFE